MCGGVVSKSMVSDRDLPKEETIRLTVGARTFLRVKENFLSCRFFKPCIRERGDNSRIYRFPLYQYLLLHLIVRYTILFIFRGFRRRIRMEHSLYLLFLGNSSSESNMLFRSKIFDVGFSSLLSRQVTLTFLATVYNKSSIPQKNNRYKQSLDIRDVSIPK